MCVCVCVCVRVGLRITFVNIIVYLPIFFTLSYRLLENVVKRGDTREPAALLIIIIIIIITVIIIR